MDSMLEETITSENQLTHNGSIQIQRQAHSLQSLLENFDLQWDNPPSKRQKLKSEIQAQCSCSRACLKDKILGFFPFISILAQYQWKKWLLFDFMSGISVGVIHIPQGMGFALLTSVPPVYGLYSSLFPVLLYFFLGTSRHISMGTMALISLMIGAVVDRELQKAGLSTDISDFGDNLTANESAELVSQAENLQVDIAVSVSLLVGIVQLLMGLLGLGVIASFMSMPFVGSFLTGAAVHIIMSQIPGLFGIKLKRRLGIFTIPLTIYDIFSHITETNICALVTGLICIMLLTILKEVINEKFKTRMRVPIPAELIVVVLATVVSYSTDLNHKYDLRIVGHIPKGIPAPRVPPLTNSTTYVGDAILIAIVSFAISISMCKMMGAKHKYKIDVRQELYAYGICHGVSSFLNCFAGAQAPPRTMVHEAVGGKTQVGSLVSCVLLLLVCLVIGPLFRTLPITVLAAVIIVALFPLFRQFKDLPRMGHINSADLVVWITTFVSIVVLDLPIGLAVGLGISIFVVILHDKMALGNALASVDHSEVFVSTDRIKPCSNLSQIPQIQIFKFGASLYFVNVETFKQELFNKTENCQELLAVKVQKEDSTPKHVDENRPAENNHGNHNLNNSTHHDSAATKDQQPVSNGFHHHDMQKTRAIILDCSLISYIDTMGINLLKTLAADYHEVGIRLVLANCHSSMLKKLSAADVLQTEEDQLSKLAIYPLVQDAVAALTARMTRVSTTTL